MPFLLCDKLSQWTQISSIDLANIECPLTNSKVIQLSLKLYQDQ